MSLVKANSSPSRRFRFLSVFGLTVSMAWLAVGCATVTIPGASPTLLSFLADGLTTRQEVIVTLGQPSGSFERESILTYRVGHHSKQGYFLITPMLLGQWETTRYSLVLLFDENGVLKQHRLVPVQ